MGRVLTGVNHPIETDRDLWARAGWSPGGNEDSRVRKMTRTETDSDPETCTGVERERQVNTATVPQCWE